MKSLLLQKTRRIISFDFAKSSLFRDTNDTANVIRKIVLLLLFLFFCIFFHVILQNGYETTILFLFTLRDSNIGYYCYCLCAANLNINLCPRHILNDEISFEYNRKNNLLFIICFLILFFLIPHCCSKQQQQQNYRKINKTLTLIG